MMEDWANDDQNLLKWRAPTAETAFEKTELTADNIPEQEYFDHGLILVAIKAGVELAFETMTDAGIKDASAYESLHEAPLIANTIARKKLYEMNNIISDTAEYGCYLFDHACKPLLKDFFNKAMIKQLGKTYSDTNAVDNQVLIEINEKIRNHPVEIIGRELRKSRTSKENQWMIRTS